MSGEMEGSGMMDMSHQHMNHSSNTTGGHSGHNMDHNVVQTSGHHSQMMMAEYFVFRSDFYVLFQSWHVKSVGDLVGACVAVFFFALFYELLKNFRFMWNHGFFDFTRRPTSGFAPPSGDCCNDDDGTYIKSSDSFWICHIIQSILYSIQIFIAFCLMLIIMTYDIPLTISICLGDGFGYFICGWLRYVLLQKRCKTGNVYLNEQNNKNMRVMIRDNEAIDTKL